MKQEYIELKKQLKLLIKQNIRKKNIIEKLQINENTYHYLLNSIRMENDEIKKIKYKEYRKKFIEKAKQDKYFKLKRRVGMFQKGEKQINRFTHLDVLNKFGENTVCYLTGKPINLLETHTYSFDHFIPLAKGGNSSLENLRVCLPEVNRMKTDLPYEDFINLCKQILSYSSRGE